MSSIARIATTLASAIVLGLALTAAATAGGPVLSAGPGYSVSCIETAVVTPRTTPRRAS